MSYVRRSERKQTVGPNPTGLDAILPVAHKNQYRGTWELGTPKGLWKTVMNSEVVLFLRPNSMYWICLGTEVTVLSSQVVHISQVVLKTGFTVLSKHTRQKSTRITMLCAISWCPVYFMAFVTSICCWTHPAEQEDYSIIGDMGSPTEGRNLCQHLMSRILTWATIAHIKIRGHLSWCSLCYMMV